jgi:hypothetical protein
VRDLAEEFAFTAHIRSRGEDKKEIKERAGHKARRWVVERTHSWLNGDGDLDLALAGQASPGSCISKVYRNNASVVNTPPSAPTSLSARVSGAGPHNVRFSWNAATDAETPQPGLTYNLRVGTTPGVDEIMSGQASVGGSGDGKRLIPTMGSCQHNTSWTLHLPPRAYYWSVQAVDTVFAGSAWAAEQSTEARPAVTPFAGGCLPGAASAAAFALRLLAAWLALGRGGRSES